ncbi:hypothetical protein BCR32DRAFT_296097 [Anaeromyces robustus]|uniref:Uncharacterized protein n=1 Tax=Anaeromyces robustus TaxID=1754192 RepID=A0A1Y1WTY2_9FUNG|nr:hypothetical protein BCR32DRAFT_296097 [Anaeromyces robustus]|eukprot:ORX76696.1 hypothetical protein BCR32DRAFT_296097 [Anaeromyces robustus]
MGLSRYTLIYIIIFLNIIHYCISESFTSYLERIEEIDISDESSTCTSGVNYYKGCILSNKGKSIIDFNNLCEIYNNSTCQNIQKSIKKSLSYCSSSKQSKLKEIIEEDGEVLPFFCYKSSDNTYCPITKLFQKYITLNEEITEVLFSNSNFLNEICLTKSCYDHIDKSYDIMNILYKNEIITDKNILNTKSNIKSYINSVNCQTLIQYNYGFLQCKPSFILLFALTILYISIFI